jgi:short-subunit dehydrogenase involved in D-alanine esterification of teichoic acids
MLTSVWLRRIMTQFPDIDSIFLNAGIQWRYNIGDPKQFDLDKFNDEIKINFTSFVVLVHAFLPYLLQKEHPTSIIL